MANYANLIQQINASIKTNGANLITGQMLQTILDNMVASLGAKYQYAGVATPATNPGTPDQNVFYLAATAGTYTNFGGLVVAEGEVAALKYNGAWAKDTTGAATADQVSQLGQKLIVSSIDISGLTISSGAIIPSSGKWGSDYYGTCCFLPITPGKRYRVVNNHANNANVVPLTTSTMGALNTVASWATGYSGVEVIEPGNEFSFVAPNDAVSLYMRLTNSSQNNIAPDVFSSIEDLNTKLDEVNSHFGFTLLTEKEREQITNSEITSDGSLSTTSSYRAYYFTNKNYGSVSATLANNTSADYAIAFYNSSSPSSSSFISGAKAKNSASFDVSADVPEGCVLIVVSNRNVQLSTPSIKIYGEIAISLPANPNGGADLKSGDKVVGNIALMADIAKSEEIVKGYVNDARIQDIRWGRLMDVSGTVIQDDRGFITGKFPCKQGDVIVVNAHGYTTGVILVIRNSSGAKLDYYNLNSEKTITITYSTASYVECSFLKTGYGATLSINGVTMFTWTQEMESYLKTIYDETFVFEDTISALSMKAMKAVKDNSIVFVHLTDTHSGYPEHMELSWAKRHMRMAMRLAERVNADFVVHTGDAIHGYSATADPAFESYEALLADIGNSPVPLIWAQGNPTHDFGYSDELTRKQVNTIMGRFGKWLMQGAVYGDTRSFYYFDMSRTPCRVLVLDPDDGGVNRKSYGFSTEQVTFVQNALSGALADGLPVAVFAHMPLTGKLMPPNTIDGTAIESALKGFVDGGGKLLCYTFGHTHWDNYYYDKPNGIPYINLVQEFPIGSTIGTQPEWGHASVYTRVVGKLSEYAMDVYVIDVASGTARIFRYGAGYDRISNIGEYNTSVGGNVTLTTELTATSWESLNGDVASVVGGVVTGVSVGDAEIIATDADGNQEFFKVTIS